jgi:hypothetical protein
MRVWQSARCTLATAVLLLTGLTACSHEQGPSEFNPNGVSADLTTAEGAFDSPAAASFDATGGAIAARLGAAAPVVVSPKIALIHPTAAQSYAKTITRLLPRTSRISASVTGIPNAYLGTTFVWDPDSSTYVASDLSGAPAKGVRFILYAIDPVTGQPVETLDELGYVDIIDVSTDTELATHVLVYAEGKTWLEYTVSGTGTASTGAVGVEGFASNGVDRVNFNLQNTIAQSANGMVLTLDYGLTVPTRSLSVDYTATFGNISPEQVAVTLDFSISGRNGDVRVSGTYGASGGAFSVRVNGEVFATVTITDGAPVVQSATGTALTAEEEASLQAILQFYDGSLGIFDDLFVPVS